MKNSNKNDTKCPHCGANIDNPISNALASIGDDISYQTNCSNCGKTIGNKKVFKIKKWWQFWKKY